MSPIEETNIAKDILVYEMLTYAARDDESSRYASLELGLLAIAATLQMCPPLSMQGNDLHWDILIETLEHSVSWIEESAADDVLAKGLYTLSEQALALISLATGAWLWREATHSSQTQLAQAVAPSGLPTLSHAG